MYNLQKARENAGISQAKLSSLSGVPIRMIRAYEAEAKTAHRDINKGEAFRIWKLAKTLGCNMEDILEIAEE